MKGKLLFVAGGVIGYVLGARAGRKRYEQIKDAANRFWESPAVQKQVDKVEEFASQKLGDVPEALGNAAKKAVTGVVEKVTSGKKGGSSTQDAGAPDAGKHAAGEARGGSRSSSGGGSGLRVPTDSAEAGAGTVAPGDATVDEARADAARPSGSASSTSGDAKTKPGKTSKDESL